MSGVPGMTKTNNITPEQTVLLDSEAMAKHIARMAHEIVEQVDDLEHLALLGILRRGVPLAERIAEHIEVLTKIKPPVGSLATVLYRDDAGLAAAMVASKGHTYFDFNVDGRIIILVDDVLAAGRTIRSAMDEVMDYGRPTKIELACLVDRGGRELPIQADYLGWAIATDQHEWVHVKLNELDGEDVVILERRSVPDANEGVGQGD